MRRVFVVLWTGVSELQFMMCNNFAIDGGTTFPVFEGIAFRGTQYLLSYDIFVDSGHLRVFHDPFVDWIEPQKAETPCKYLIVKVVKRRIMDIDCHAETLHRIVDMYVCRSIIVYRRELATHLMIIFWVRTNEGAGNRAITILPTVSCWSGPILFVSHFLLDPVP